MEPRAIPAATRGTKPWPHSGSGTTKPDSKTNTEHESGNNPECRKHLKSLVLAQDTPGFKARHLGLDKTRLEHLAAATAINCIRLDAWYAGKPLDRTRTTHLQRLDLTTAA